jgi:phytoene dehydrogenase-like protein
MSIPVLSTRRFQLKRQDIDETWFAKGRMSRQGIIIIGGGLAGLCGGRRLHEAGVSFRLLEASDDVDGRARTDIVEPTAGVISALTASLTHYLIKRRQLSRLLRNQPNVAMASLCVVTTSTQDPSKERCCRAAGPRSVRCGV